MNPLILSNLHVLAKEMVVPYLPLREARVGRLKMNLCRSNCDGNIKLRFDRELFEAIHWSRRRFPVPYLLKPSQLPLSPLLLFWL